MLRLGLGLDKNTFQRNIVRNGLVLYLDGKDFSNSPPTATWRDRSGLGNNATSSGMAYTTASGSDGNGGVVFDGVNDYCSIANNSNFDFGSGDFTISFNANIKVMNSIFGFICKRFAGNSGYSFDIRYDNGNIKFSYTTDGITSVIKTFSKTLLINTEYQIVIRRIGAYINCFVDGVSLGEQDVSTTTIFTSTENVIIGALNASGTKVLPLNGTVLNLLIYKNKGLTDTEILKNYNASK